MPKISIIMSTYKEPVVHIKQSVDSMLNQTFQDFEFIIVIDDPTNAEAEKFLADCAQKDSRIVVLKNEKNMGLVKSLNRALSVVTGEYVARMDADDFSYPERLETELAYIQTHSLDIIGGLVCRMTEDGEVLPNSLTRHYSPKQISRLLNYGSYLPHPTWMVRKCVYDTLGGYREMPKCEDYDLLLRARNAGFKIGLCDSCVLNYRITSTGISQTGLLKQWAASRYISKNSRNIEAIKPQDVVAWVEQNIAEKQIQNYNQANRFFSQAVSSKSNPLKCLVALFKAFTASKYFRVKLMHMLMVRFIRITN